MNVMQRFGSFCSIIKPYCTFFFKTNHVYVCSSCPRYLQEVGYTDTILDVKSQRVRALLGLAGDGGGRAGDPRSTEPLVNGTDTTKGNRGWVWSSKCATFYELQHADWCVNAYVLNRKAELSDTSAVLEAFKFIENAAAEFSDEEEEEDSEGKDRTTVESRTVWNQTLLTTVM